MSAEDLARELTTLAVAARDPDATIAASATAALDALFTANPTRAAIDALLKVVGDPAYARSIRDDALESLGQLEAPEAIEVLCEALDDDTVDAFVKRNCAAALGYIGEAEALPVLQQIVATSGDRELVETAKQAIEEIEENVG